MNADFGKTTWGVPAKVRGNLGVTEVGGSLVLMRLQEYCGLGHDRQVIRVAMQGGIEKEGVWRGREKGGIYRVQRSKVDAEAGFLDVELAPFETLTLVEGEEGGDGDGVRFEQVDAGTGRISNGMFSLEVPMGEETGTMAGWDVSGPVRRMRVREGAWRGLTFFDLRGAVKSWKGEMVENGSVRAVYRYRVEFAPKGFYEATVTLDRGQRMAVIEEEFRGGSGDQIVWSLSGEDLPGEMFLLDSSAGYLRRPLFYYFDQRLTRLMCWTQQSQHFDFSDGYAVGFGGREIVGFVALEGGTWRGGKLNHMEAWTRRWMPGDPASRRDVAWEAKADAQPGPERIPARGTGRCEGMFAVEGWIGEGRRKWALVLATEEEIKPADPSGAPLEHFEDKPDRARYRAQQSLLRRIHTQRGILPLQTLLGMEFCWAEEAEGASDFCYPNDILARHLPEGEDLAEARRGMMEYLAARVYGFWEGSGSAYTNPVVSRRVAPEMYRYEWLVKQGALSDEEKGLIRAQFAFLMHLFASENYYTGDASMLPVESADSLEPTLAGMANQNFYTDVINVPGTGAQVFANHPRAVEWRAFFIERWHRQLAYHMYPESGVWEESQTYYHHVLHTVLPTFLRRRADGVDDEFANPAFQRLAGAELRQITPRDAYFGGSRHVVIFGDHGIEVEKYRYLWRVLAEGFAGHDQEVAEGMAWIYAEMGGTKARRVPGKAPAVRNEYVQGLGVMFRGYDEAGGESLLALRAGAAWGHHHNDDGSIQFYAKGRAMIVDSAFGMAQINGARKVQAGGHSRWTLKGVEPVSHFFRFTRGWITEAELDGPLAYATGYSPVILAGSNISPAVPMRMPVSHYRTIVQVTPVAYLVMDVADTGMEQVVRFHVPGKENVGLSGASGVIDFEGGSRLHVAPLMGIEAPGLDVDYPKGTDAERYITTAVEYGIGRAAVSAFLIAAQDAAPEIAERDGEWRARGEGFDLRVRRELAGIAIRENSSGSGRIVRYR